MNEPREPMLHVLLVDDDPMLRRALVRTLQRKGYSAISTAESASAALETIEKDGPDVVISDMSMPGASGLDLLRAIRGRDLELPVIFLTGMPSVDTAARAVELGAFRYLTKPLAEGELERALTDAARARDLARARGQTGGRVQLEQAFRRALDALSMAYQPIVSAQSHEAIGYEALMRSGEPALPNPLAVLDAAEKLGALHFLGQQLRRLVAETIAHTATGPLFYVNLHVADLADPDLFDEASPLSAHAPRVVLELTERASLEAVPDFEERLERLRSMGYRLAVDDLGAGYAGLSYFASVRPDVIKIDLSLVRDVHRDPVKREVVRSLTALASTLAVEVVAEGIEATEERDVLIELGCTHLQGYALARPGPAFPDVRWG